ncbi:hypothetical protein P3C58_10780 [Mesorhizobium sp. XAP10]|uniref:hypothetical protein n=1 Tax=unclassified Mesorhizobium TaxID=325217 RepID=UPI0023DE9A77|nr:MULTISPECIES: hypothetical protein [unclassified Mesorhizobium]MDF3152464.1 hypothetical protein [Mesorhizobium sp. XAP10]MDF3245526.1 hypothetical protein [Mesorhizobium sp. XAP4]
MSVVAEVPGKAGETLKKKPLKWPKFRLGRFLCGITEAYASATWKAYGAATGLGENNPEHRPDNDVGNY